MLDFRSVLIVCFLGALVACGGGGGGGATPPPTTTVPPTTTPPPVADAGSNQAVDEGDDVILSGDGSENVDSYSWRQTAGPGVQLNNSNSSAPTFTAPSISGETVLTFELTVNNDSGDSRTDSVSVVVIFGNSASLSRPTDPVILIGEDLPMLKGTAPDSLVAFRYEGGWVQIPIQVDERDMRSYGEIYNFFLNGFMGQDIHPLVAEFYTDPNTYMGPDTDPMLDDNDEVVFMARDAGTIAPAIADPPGIIAGLRAEVRVSDPLDGTTGYVYLFQSAGGLDPSAGQSYVDYQFRLQSGDYRATFAPEGINLESSTASSEYYERTFTSRWLTEVLRITAPGASGVDILDRRKIRLRPDGGTGLCFEPETEAGGEELEGAFVANKSGPVRGIRSHVGFRSGPEIQQDHFFYEQREDIVVHWRVHAVSFSVFVFVDYDPAAIGMTYFNNNNTGGVIIDGVPDSIIPGVLRWELVSGSPGSLAIIQDLVSNFSPNASSYYLDDDSPVPPQCLGDAFAIGSSGQSIIAFIPDTDLRTSSNTLAWVSSRHYGPPGWSVADAEQLRAFNENPLVTTVAN